MRRVETLDGVERTVGVRGRSLGDTGEDCLICDAEGTPVGIGGIMGGASSEIADGTTEVLLEAAYFTPMAIARTSKRLGLRTEASARFERGCDPWGIETSVARFCQLLGESVPDLEVADGLLDVRGQVPESFVVRVPVARVHSQIGVELSGERIAELIGPLGFDVLEPGGDGVLEVMIPTNRPDVRPEPYGVDDVIEEIARTFGYSNVPRRTPTWPQPGGLTVLQRNRRLAKDVLCGLGASEGWTDTFVSAAQHAEVGLTGDGRARVQPARCREALPAPLPVAGAAGRAGLQRRPAPGRRAALRGRRGLLPPRRGDAPGGRTGRRRWAWNGPSSPESASCSRPSSPTRTTTPARPWCPGASWPTPSVSTTSACCARRRTCRRCPASIRPARPIWSWTGGGERDRDRRGGGDRPRRRHHVRADAHVGRQHRRRAGSGGSRWTSGSSSTRSGCPGGSPWAARSAASRRRTSTWPSWSTTPSRPTPWPTGSAAAAGDLLESVTLFDVYRGTGITEGARSLAYRLRFCAPDRTLTDEEVGQLRARCIEAAEQEFGPSCVTCA